MSGGPGEGFRVPREGPVAGEGREARVRRLKLRAMRRGIKEMDVILGPWAAANLDRAGTERLDAFEAILAENDQDLYRWATGRAPAPAPIAPLLAEIAAEAEARHAPRRDARHSS